jgi:hypothetical protein
MDLREREQGSYRLRLQERAYRTLRLQERARIIPLEATGKSKNHTP